MITIIKKYIVWIILALAILVGVLYFQTRGHGLRVWDTAVRLEDIRAISQLVSASYTGEASCDYFTAHKALMDSLCQLDASQRNAWFSSHSAFVLLKTAYFPKYQPVFELQRQMAQLNTAMGQEQNARKRDQLNSDLQRTQRKLEDAKRDLYKLIVNPDKNYFTLASGTVRAGINLDLAKIDNDKEQILLPAPQLLDTVVEKRENYLGSGNRLTEPEAEAIRCDCAERLAGDAVRSGNILRYANENAVATLKQFLRGLKKEHYTIVVQPVNNTKN